MDAPVTRAPAARRLLRGGPLLRLRSDEQLLASFRAGNDDAFQVLHDRYRQRLFTYARQMLGGSTSDAEDAMQDVFLRAYGALRADERPVSVRAWLYRVAHNRCIDQLRRPRPATVELHDELQASALHDPLTEASRREDLQRLVTDVGRLPEQQRSALLLREMEGLSYVELATALECSVPAVKSLLVRARMGLVEQAEARALSCADIRDDLDQAHDRGVRMTGRARRHLRDCAACRSYRDTLKGVSTGLHSLSPSAGPWGLVMKILGIGSAGSGAAAGGAATMGAGAASGGGVALIGGGAAATASKVAAIVCCAAVVGGGAAEVQHRIVPPKKQEERGQRAAAPRAAAPVAAAAVAAPAPAAARRAAERPTGATSERRKAEKDRRRTAMHAETDDAALPAVGLGTADEPTADGGLGGDPAAAPVVDPTGGAQAPDEPVAPTTTDTGPTAPTTGTGHGTGTGSGSGTGTTTATTTPGALAGQPTTVEPPRDTGAPAGAAAPAAGPGGASGPGPSGTVRP
ncbi:RNA polymerase sigma factor [Paraconexibacter algicola]|uniref:Sigma-70 family RNA polymerase sigma factor n=1 Tax=Paraconexibacter algicola TaxID=2133960 RepID=A0A2T4UBZ9_9ACTN|nr:sigma-70 family RNA polymerase sigma factor [Paraconexibacter algicola]PTL54406.1 hypothetical protein C7Y72_21985 [Paraconexibacter algicola]